jgi:cell division cycle 20-like protein 1 (cofactor of APC complex)
MNSNYEKRLIKSDLNSSNNSYNHTTPEKFSDRFTPIRESPDWQIRYGLIQSPSSSTKVINTKRSKDDQPELRDESIAYECLLHNEILNAGIEDIKEQRTSNDSAKKANPVLTPRRNLFRFKLRDDDNIVLNDIKSSPYSLSPVGVTSQNLLKSPKKSYRKISKNPFKVLDAPDLQDDFYLNLVDWSSTNLLSVGLGPCVYLWSACTSQVTRLCDLSAGVESERPERVTSVSWSERGNYVAVGCESGMVQVWDVTATKQINTLTGHTNRVGALAWNGDILLSGSRDRSILQRDIRTPCVVPDRKLEAHKQEVCGLKWSPDNQNLASGGNDNKLFIWNMHSLHPCQAYHEHGAAVKAIAWSPHHHGLLASGGGTADRKIRFWNTLTGQPMQMVDTGSQVCNLAWSKHASELVSTHGYSQNQILVWKYPSLMQVAKLIGHNQRVLYLATSPDGDSIVTGAGDETLRFWNVFTKTRPRKVSKSALNLFASIR